MSRTTFRAGFHRINDFHSFLPDAYGFLFTAADFARIRRLLRLPRWRSSTCVEMFSRLKIILRFATPQSSFLDLTVSYRGASSLRNELFVLDLSLFEEIAVFHTISALQLPACEKDICLCNMRFCTPHHIASFSTQKCTSEVMFQRNAALFFFIPRWSTISCF